MSHGGRSSACTASTNTAPPKILALGRNLDSQTYSAFIEEAEILDSFATMEPPVRYSLTAPSKRFYCAIIMGQLFLLSTVVALVLTIINYHRADQGDRVSYIVWLVFSASATFFFILLTFVFFHQRRKLCAMQCKLQRMHAEAEAHGSQKRLDTSSAGAPQLRAETDHRLSVLAQRHFEAAEGAAVAEPAGRRTSVIAASPTGRRRQMSSAAGEGCELSLFQTHLSNGSTKDGVADLTTTSSAVQTPPPTYMNPLQRPLQRESTTTRLFEDDPTMMDLFHGLPGARNNNNNNSRSSSLAIRPRRSITYDPLSPTPSPRRRTATILSSRRLSAALQAPSDPFTPAANRSSTALPQQHSHSGAAPAAAIDDSSSSTAFSRTRAISTASSCPDYGILLPAFPLPPSHARFSDPSLAPPSPPPRLPPPPPPTREEMRDEEKKRTMASLPPLRRVSCTAGQPQEQQPRGLDLEGMRREERTVWGRMAKVMGMGRGRASSAAVDDVGEERKGDGEEDKEEERERRGMDGRSATDGNGGDFLGPRRFDTTTTVHDGRRDSHVDPDQSVDGESTHGGVVDEDSKTRARRRSTIPQAQSTALPTADDRPSTWCAPQEEQHQHRRHRSQPVTTVDIHDAFPAAALPYSIGLQHHHTPHRRSSASSSSSSSLSAASHTEPSHHRANSIASSTEDLPPSSGGNDGTKSHRKQSVSSGAWRAASTRGRSGSGGSRFVEEEME